MAIVTIEGREVAWVHGGPRGAERGQAGHDLGGPSAATNVRTEAPLPVTLPVEAHAAIMPASGNLLNPQNTVGQQ